MRKTIFALLVIALMTLSYVGGRRHSQPLQANAAPSAHRVLYYIDPMHPAYKSEQPGIAPDCGMKLEPVYADEGESLPVSAGAIHIDSQKQQLIGVRVSPVEKSSGTSELRLTGRVVADETRIYRVNSGTEGWVEQTFSDSVGTQVTKGQRLASFYSRDLWAAEQNLLAGTYGTTPSKEPGQATQAAIDRLRNLGVSEEQIKEISQNRKSSTLAFITSPSDGFIMTRNISPGEKFERGIEFYRIVDLRHLWIVADVFENDTQYYRPGMTATVTLPQGKKLQARVSNVLPQIDPATRTFKLRLDADNPRYDLRPDMFVDVHLSVKLPAGLSVPSDALVDSGLNKRVYVETGPGTFEPRQVETGWRLGDRLQVTHGLRAGDRVVSAGTFLVDSESKLQASAAGAAPAPVSRPETATPETPRQIVQEIKQMKANKSSVKDPKCGMEVDAAKAATEGHTLTYNGKSYYFCSRDCKDEFEKNPEKYLGSNREMAGAR